MMTIWNNSCLHPQIETNERNAANFHENYRYSSSSPSTSLENFDVQESDEDESFEHSSHQSSNANSSVELYRCKYCDFKTNLFEYLLIHGRDIHRRSFKKKFFCNACLYSAAKRWKVIEHMKYHGKLTGIILHECQICPFKAPQRHQLDRHVMFIHQDVGKKYKCHVCFEELQSKTLLKKHKRTHK